jgi:hypothetical protein
VARRRLPLGPDRDDTSQDVDRGGSHTPRDLETVSNAARQDAVHTELESARDTAFPLVETASFALQVPPIAPAIAQRWIDIVERSQIGEAQRARLVERLMSDRVVSDAIGSAMRELFGGDSAALREQVSEALNHVWQGLASGASNGEEWSLPDGASVAVARGGAESLIEALADHHGASGAAIRTFCVRVAPLTLFEEEEEDSWGVGTNDLDAE